MFIKMHTPAWFCIMSTVCLSAGLLNPLDSPHHMRMDEQAVFREGLVLDRPCKAEKGSFVDCGMRKVVVFLIIVL